MFKRFVARVLIFFQIYSTFFHGLIYGGIYDEIPGDYRISIGISSPDIPLPSFKLFVVDPTTKTETLLEDFSLEGVAKGDIALDIDTKQMTPTSEGLVWDVDGLRFIATRDGQLVVKGRSVHPTRKWIVQTAASIVLEDVHAKDFDISSPVIVTTGETSIDDLRLSGISVDSQWINTGAFGGKQAFLANLWVENGGSVNITRASAEQSFGLENAGTFTTRQFLGGKGLLHNHAGAILEGDGISLKGNLLNEGAIVGSALLSTANASIHNRGNMKFAAWEGAIKELSTDGIIEIEQTDITVELMQNAGALHLGSKQVTDRVRAKRFVNTQHAWVESLFVSTHFENAGEAIIASLTSGEEAILINTSKGTFKSGALLAQMNIGTFTNDGDVELTGDVDVGGVFTNNGRIKAKGFFMQQGRFTQNGDIQVATMAIEPGAHLITKELSELHADTLEFAGEGDAVLEGDVHVKRFVSLRKVIGRGIIRAEEFAHVKELHVPIKGDFFTEDLAVEGDLTVGGLVNAHTRSFIGGDIVTEGVGRLALEDFSALATPKIIHNEGKTFLHFSPEFAASSTKGSWNIINAGALTIDQHADFTPTGTPLPAFAASDYPFIALEQPTAKAPLAALSLRGAIASGLLAEKSADQLKRMILQQYRKNTPNGSVEKKQQDLDGKSSLELKHIYVADYNAPIPHNFSDIQRITDIRTAKSKAKQHKQEALRIPVNDTDSEIQKITSVYQARTVAIKYKKQIEDTKRAAVLQREFEELAIQEQNEIAIRPIQEAKNTAKSLASFAGVSIPLTEHPTMLAARNAVHIKHVTNDALKKRDRLLGLVVFEGDHAELRAVRDLTQIREIGIKALHQIDYLLAQGNSSIGVGSASQSSSATSIVNSTPKDCALPLLFINQGSGMLRLANGDFRLGASSNRNSGFVVIERASIWKEDFANSGLLDVKGNYDIVLPSVGYPPSLYKIRGDSPISVYADVGINLSYFLPGSIETKQIIYKRPGNFEIMQDFNVMSPLSLDIIGDIVAKAKLRSPFIEVLRAKNLRTLESGNNVGMLISTVGPLVLNLEEEITTPIGYLFGKTGIHVRAKSVAHGSYREKTDADVDAKYKWVANQAKWQADSGDIDVQAENITNSFGKISADKGRLILNGKVITNLAGTMYGLLGGEVHAQKFIVKRIDPLASTSGGGCAGHQVYTMHGWVRGTCGGCIPRVTTYTELSEEAIFRVDGDLFLNVDQTEVLGSQITALGNIRFKTGNWRERFDTVRGDSVSGLKVGSRSTATAVVRAGQHLRAELANLDITGRLEGSSIFMSAVNFAMASLGITDDKGRPMQLVNLTDALKMLAKKRPWLTLTGSDAYPMVEHVAPLSLGYDNPIIPLMGAEHLPGTVHLGSTLPIIQDFARELIMGLSFKTVNMGPLALRTLFNNAFQFDEQDHQAIMREEAQTTSGEVVTFGRVNFTKQQLEQAATAMIFAELKKGQTRAENDIEASRRLANTNAPREISEEIPTLDMTLMIPAQQAPTSSVGVVGEFGVQGKFKKVDMKRGRQRVIEGDAVKGCEYEVFMDPLLIQAPQGQVMIDAEEGFMDNVQVEAKDGAHISSNITQLQTLLYSRSWDYTKELLEQQRRSMMAGGMSGNMMPETAAFRFSFGGSGSSVSGFAPGGGKYWSQIENSRMRFAAKKIQEADERFRKTTAQINSFFGQMGGEDLRSKVIPVGIIERMEMHRDEMIQFHAQQQYEREVEDFLATYEYADQEPINNPSSSTEHVKDRELKKAIEDNPELGKALATQRRAKEKLHLAAQLERQEHSLSRDSLVESLDIQSVSSARQVAISNLRQQAYEMIATANDRLNVFAQEHPELTHYTVKVMEWGAVALHVGMYVGAGMTGGPVGIATLMAVEQAIGAGLEAAIEIGADHAAASGKTQEESIRLRESFLEMTGKGLMVAAVVGLKGMKGAKAVKPGAVQIKFNYASEGAAYSLRIDPITGKGPMHIDMSKVPAISTTKTGASRNAGEFWRIWGEKYPDALSEGNMKLASKGKSPIVDAQWIQHFPEHNRYFGEIIEHHHLDYGSLAYPLPKGAHRGGESYKMWHQSLGGNDK